MSAARLLRAIVAAVIALFVVAAPASAAVSQKAAGRKALSALGVKQGKQPVVVFSVKNALRGGTVLAQAGQAKPPTPGGTLGTNAATAPVLLKVGGGQKAWAFYADWAPYQAYAHRGQLAIVDAASGKVRLSSFLTSPPVIDGHLPEFMRSGKAYRSAANRIFVRDYVVDDTTALTLASRAGFGYRLDRAPFADQALAKLAADQLAADKVCALRVSDTFGDFYDFTGADNTRARLGDLLYVLRKLNPGIVDQRYSRSSRQSPIAALRELITSKGCKDVLFYIAGRGFSSGDGTTVSVGTRVRGRTVTQQLVRAADLLAVIKAFPGVNFNVKVDAPHTKPFVDLLAKQPNVLLAESAAGADGSSFGYLPYVKTTGGKTITNVGNPDGLLSFTNRTIAGIQRFLTSATEVNGAVGARKNGQIPSLLAVLLGRAFELGRTDDLPSVVGVQKPFFSPTPFFPSGPPPAPIVNNPPTQPNRAPLASALSVTTDEDTAATFTIPVTDPDGDALTVSLSGAPAHGTVTTNGLNATYTPAADYAGADEITFKVTDPKGLSVDAKVTLTVTPVNDKPRVATSTGTATFTEGGAAAVVDPAITVADPDDTTLAGAKAVITAGGTADDELLFTNASGITGTYDVPSRTLTLTGSATVATYQAALRSITFRVTGANPAGGTRTIAFTASDASGAGTAASRSVAVNTINDAPTLANGGSAVAYSENDAPTVIDNAYAITDPDSPNLAGATVSITAGLVSAEDRLRYTDANGITGSYNTASGVLTLTGSATAATYATALRTVRYENLSDDPSTAARTITARVNDGAALSNLSNTVTNTVNVTAVNDAPVVTTTATPNASYTEDGSAAVLDAGVTVTDVDSANLSGAVVSIGTGRGSTDALNFTNQAGITGSFNSATGVLTLTGTATLAQYQTALRSITFSLTGDNPSTATRSVDVRVSDTAPLNSNTATRSLDVTAVNDAPVLGGGPLAAVNYTEDSANVAIAPAITAADPDDTNLTGATIAITAGAQSDDLLVFVDANGITGSYNASTHVLTLTGTASVATYQAALRSIGFSTPNQNPVTAARTISITVDDGHATSHASNTLTVSATVTAVNDAPTVSTTSSPNASYTEDGSAVVVDAGVTLADVDSANLTGATVSIGTGRGSTDALNFTNQAGITGSFNSATGVLTLTGTATLAQYQTALRSITFSLTGDNPSTATRSITFQVTDAPASNSNIATRTLDVTAVNDAPVLGGGPLAAKVYTEDAAGVALAPTITTADPDDTNLTGGTVTIGTGVQSDDVLNFTNQNGITGSFNAGTHVLTLSGSATLANYQTALRSITFSTPNQNAVTAARTVDFVVDDGHATSHASNSLSVSVTVSRVNDAPTLTTTGGTTNFGEGDSPVAIDTGLTVADVDSANLASATVAITGGTFVAGDVLGFTNQSGITGSYNSGTGVLTLTGSSSLANYQTALRTVTFSNPSTSLPSANRTISFVGNDGTDASSAATKTVHFAAINTAPNVTASGGSTAIGEGSAGAAIDTGLTVTDSDDTDLSGATVAVTTGLAAGDELQFTNQNGITGSYNSGTGVLTLSGTATVANYQTALRTVKFRNPGPATPSGTRTVTFTASDSSNDSDSDTKGITFTAVDDAPVIATSAGSTAYTENGAGVAVDAALTLSDPDSASLVAADASITDAVSGDRLRVPGSYTVPGTLTVSGSGTATISITGSASPTAYRDLLRAIEFDSTSDDPTSATRHVRFRASDATTQSTVSTNKSVAVTAVNDAPIAVADAFTTDEDTVKLGDVRSNDTDLDHATNTLTVDQVDGASGNVGNQVTLASGAKVTIDASGNLSYDPRGAFDSLQVGDPNATDSVTYRVKDPLNATSNTATVTFTITPVNDAPRAVARTYNAIRNTALELEPGANAISAPRVRLSGSLVVGATDADDAVGAAPITDQTVATTGGGVVDLDPDGSFVYTSEPGESASTDSFTFTISDSHGASSNQTVTLNLEGHLWFVDNDNAGAADGTSTKPFKTVAAATTAASTGDTIYVGASATSTAAAATLKNNQTLTTAGKQLDFTIAGAGTPTGSVTLAPAATTPVLAASSGSALTLGSGNTLEELDIQATSTAKGITATSGGTLNATNVNVSSATGTAVDLTSTAGTISNLDVTTTGATGLKLATSSVSVGTGSSIAATGGPAIDSSGATGGTLAFGNVSSTNSGTTGISLGGSAAFSATGGSVSGSSGIGVDVSGGAAAITYPGTITPASGAGAARVQSRTGGTTTLSGNITTAGNSPAINVASNTGGTIAFSGSTKTLVGGTSNAVSLSNNTGATVNFTGGGLAASSTVGDAFRATGGGTVSVSGAGNTISAGSGAAVHVVNTNTSGLTFQSISDSGGSEGIYLDGTGSGASLTVTGDAGTTRNASGGVITGVTAADGATTGSGVYLNDTDGVNLEQMQITSSGNHGVVASNVVGLTLAHGTIDHNGSNENTPYNESNVRITGATGTIAVTDQALSTPQSNNLYLTASSGTATLNVTGSAFTMDPSRSGVQNDSILVDGGAGSINTTISNNSFTGAAGDQVQLAASNNGNGAWVGTLTNNTMTSSYAAPSGDDLAGGVSFGAGNFNGTFDYTISGNDVDGSAIQGINVFQGTGSSTVKGTISGNTIGDQGTPLSGGHSDGIIVAAGGSGAHNTLIQNNHVSGAKGFGSISLNGPQGNTAGVLNATVKNNTVDTPTSEFAGIYADLGNATVNSNGVFCLDVQNNSVAGSYTAGKIAVATDYNITLRAPGYTGGAFNDSQFASYLAGRNTSMVAGDVLLSNASTVGYANTPGGAACPQP